MLTKYNANVIRFHSMRWYKKDHTEVLAEAWEQVLEDERADPRREGELDEAALELELLDDDEIEVFHSWCLSHPKSIMKAGVTLSSSPALAMKTSSSGLTTIGIEITPYDPDKLEIVIPTSEGGMSFLSHIFERIRMSSIAVTNLFSTISRVSG